MQKFNEKNDNYNIDWWNSVVRTPIIHGAIVSSVRILYTIADTIMYEGGRVLPMDSNHVT